MLAAISYAMVILMGIACLFFAGSVANTLAQHTGNKSDIRARVKNLYLSRIFGGIGFIVLAADGVLTTPFLNSPQWIWTSIISIAFGALGIILLKIGLKTRKILLTGSEKKS